MDLKYELRGNSSVSRAFCRKELCYNPVEQHLFLLRQSAIELDELNKKAKALQEKNYINEKECMELCEYSIPSFPENYPFSLSPQQATEVETLLKQREEIKVKVSGFLTEKEMAKLIQNFVKSVLIQTGYFVSDNEAMECLIDSTNRFLAHFVFILRRNKSSKIYNDNDNLWGPLESTLREIGFGGINGVHAFYYDKIVKKHDRLFHMCEEELCKYNKIRKEVLQLTHAHGIELCNNENEKKF